MRYRIDSYQKSVKLVTNWVSSSSKKNCSILSDFPVIGALLVRIGGTCELNEAQGSFWSRLGGSEVAGATGSALEFLADGNGGSALTGVFPRRFGDSC